MKYSLGISNFLKEISTFSHSIVFLYFSALIAEEGFLISPCYSLQLCVQMGISFLKNVHIAIFPAFSNQKEKIPNLIELHCTQLFFFLNSVASPPIYSLKSLFNSFIFTHTLDPNIWQVFQLSHIFNHSIQLSPFFCIPISPLSLLSFYLLYFHIIIWMWGFMNPSSISLKFKFSIIFHMFISASLWGNP